MKLCLLRQNDDRSRAMLTALRGLPVAVTDVSVRESIQIKISSGDGASDVRLKGQPLSSFDSIIVTGWPESLRDRIGNSKGDLDIIHEQEFQASLSSALYTVRNKIFNAFFLFDRHPTLDTQPGRARLLKSIGWPVKETHLLLKDGRKEDELEFVDASPVLQVVCTPQSYRFHPFSHLRFGNNSKAIPQLIALTQAFMLQKLIGLITLKILPAGDAVSAVDFSLDPPDGLSPAILSELLYDALI